MKKLIFVQMLQNDTQCTLQTVYFFATLSKTKKTDSITVKLCEICKNYMQEYHNYHKINHNYVPQVCLEIITQLFTSTLSVIYR